MGLILVFLALAAAGGTACYFLLRPLFRAAWAAWREGRQGALEDQRRREHTQELRREALDSVLAQIGHQDEAGRRAV